MRSGEFEAGISFNNRDPVYLQVIRHFKEQIVTGQLLAGQSIPSRRELGALLKINPNTAQRAYREMEEQQLIVTEGNSPSRITTDEHILLAIRAELLGEAVKQFVSSVINIDVPIEELLGLIREEYRSNKQARDQAGAGGLHND